MSLTPNMHKLYSYSPDDLRIVVRVIQVVQHKFVVKLRLLVNL